MEEYEVQNDTDIIGPIADIAVLILQWLLERPVQYSWGQINNFNSPFNVNCSNFAKFQFEKNHAASILCIAQSAAIPVATKEYAFREELNNGYHLYMYTSAFPPNIDSPFSA